MKIILKRPLINEKSMILIKNNFYTFEVDKTAQKDEIGRVIKDKFNVDVLSIRIVNLPSKLKLQRSRKGYYQTPQIKKAIVKIKDGQKIALFETVETEVTTADSEVKEKKNFLKGTKVKIEKGDK